MIIKLCTFLLLLTAVQCQYSKGGRFEQQKDGSQSQQRPNVDGDGSDGNSVEAGPEPPSIIPQTNFICEDKPYPLGMYADLETGCTVYHMCFDGRKESFLCGTGTVFNQEILSCDHPQNVVCEDSPKYYDANTELGKSVPEPSGGGGQRPVPGGGGQRPVPGGGGQRPIPGGPIQRPVPAPGPRPQPGPGPRPQPGRPDYPRPIAPQPGQRPAPIPSGPDGPDEYDRPSVVPRPVQPRPIQPRPQPGKPVGPRPVPSGPGIGIGKPSPGKPSKPRPPPSVGRPLPPTAVRPRPRPVEPQRPIVQTSDDGQLDYEPSALSYYQQKPEASFRRAYFARPARQWRLMSESYA